MEVEKKKKEKKKLATVKIQHRVTGRGSNIFDKELEENPFNNKDIIKKLVDECTLPKVVDRIIEADPKQCTWVSLGSFLEVS
ncbi:putative ensconsin-like [Cocos nucifera]|nr:putative ensconsin-like [Cocos nucifera]